MNELILPIYFSHPTLGELVAREMKNSDIAYCARSWLATHRDSKSGRLIRSDKNYHSLHGPLIRGMLNDLNLIRIVVSPIDDVNSILGFAVSESKISSDISILHYLHIRGFARGQGLATKIASIIGIIPNVPFAVTYSTRDLERLPKRWQASHRPDLLERIR
jgi:hypothetical protein